MTLTSLPRIARWSSRRLFIEPHEPPPCYGNKIKITDALAAGQVIEHGMVRLGRDFIVRGALRPASSGHYGQYSPAISGLPIQLASLFWKKSQMGGSRSSRPVTTGWSMVECRIVNGRGHRDLGMVAL